MTTTIDPPVRRQSSHRPAASTGYLAWLAFAGLLCVATALFAASAYVTLDIDASRAPVRGPVHFGLLVTHIATGALALVVGVAQFWPWLRNRHPQVHRRAGRLYLFAGVLPSALFGVVVANLSLAGLDAQVPLTMLSVLWFGTAVQGLRTARARQYREHRVWMIRNFALTTAAVTGRLWGMLLATLVPDGDGVFAAANWLSFTINLLVAEWWIQRGRQRRVIAA